MFGSLPHDIVSESSPLPAYHFDIRIRALWNWDHGQQETFTEENRPECKLGVLPVEDIHCRMHN